MSSKLHDPKEEPFPCTSCGACCMAVAEVPDLKELGWVQGDGSCLNYDRKTKRCAVYADRPLVCRVDAVRPPLLSRGAWVAINKHACDWLHQQLYKQPREQEGVCGHEVPKGGAGSGSGTLDPQPEGSTPSPSTTREDPLEVYRKLAEMMAAKAVAQEKKKP